MTRSRRVLTAALLSVAAAPPALAADTRADWMRDLRQKGAFSERFALMVAVAAFGVESAALREGFEECRLPAAVFSDEER